MLVFIIFHLKMSLQPQTVFLKVSQQSYTDLVNVNLETHNDSLSSKSGLICLYYLFEQQTQ